jgi:hypothetical protein
MDSPQKNQHHNLIFLLIGLMILTRNHQWTPIVHLPDASLALFFIAGARITGLRYLLLMMCFAFGIDAYAIGWGHVSSYCLSPAYFMLIPTYACMWMFGRWHARQTHSFSHSLPSLLGIGFSATLLSELLSSGGFYAFSGRFQNPTMLSFLPRLWQYSPPVILHTLIYLSLWYGLEYFANKQTQALRH